jgi:hypothetical protein
MHSSIERFLVILLHALLITKENFAGFYHNNHRISLLRIKQMVHNFLLLFACVINIKKPIYFHLLIAHARRRQVFIPPPLERKHKWTNTATVIVAIQTKKTLLFIKMTSHYKIDRDNNSNKVTGIGLQLDKGHKIHSRLGLTFLLMSKSYWSSIVSYSPTSRKPILCSILGGLPKLKCYLVQESISWYYKISTMLKRKGKCLTEMHKSI